MEVKRVKTKNFLGLSYYSVAQNYISLERVISGEIETKCFMYLPVTTSLLVKDKGWIMLQRKYFENYICTT